jgi:MerR family transcriptional regulator, heat shock protein HspR
VPGPTRLRGVQHLRRRRTGRLHPQTLRIYEREGLVEPARSARGTRRHGQNDISRLLEMSALSSDGLNLAGIRRVLAR